jgi:hypothetical protein
MYHPSVACGAHEDLFADFLWTNTLVPDGPIGWELKLNCPWTWACADSCGLILDPLTRLRVSMACGKILPPGEVGIPCRMWLVLLLRGS